ncbi:MAG: c-type cytochrome [Pseudomonadota bacterium]|nr:c-type cytochrome [Pseudomonadota bacterium]
MRNNALLAAGLLTAMLAACGSSEPAPVVEQIVVREPGAPAANATMEQSAETAGEVDLVSLGMDAFQACAGCHNADEGGPNMAGPNLYGVVGRKAGGVESYSYSDALAGSDITWDAASLDRFLANPSGYVPGTDMVAGAVRDGERRAAIVAYLASTSE